MSYRSDIAILRKIARSAQGFANFISDSSCLTFPMRSVDQSSCAVLDLPPPQPLTAELIALGLGVVMAERCSSAFMDCVSRLKAECEVQFQRGSLVLLDGPNAPTKTHSLLRAAYTSRYMKMSKELAEQVIIRAELHISQFREDENDCGQGQFHQDVVSVLEDFFECDPFPSREDKLSLAAKTALEYKQINVWFQNRRNRSKGDRNISRESGSSDTQPLAIRHVIDNISMNDEDQASRNGCVAISDDLNTPPLQSAALFSVDRPLHVYPSAYPPSCSYNPFPADTVARNFSTPWLRQHQSEFQTRSSSVDIAQLTESFAKMNLSEPFLNGAIKATTTSRAAKRFRSVLSSCTTAVGFNTTVPRAPLPSLHHVPSSLGAVAVTQQSSVRGFADAIYKTKSETQFKPQCVRRSRRCPTVEPVDAASQPTSVLTSSISSHLLHSSSNSGLVCSSKSVSTTLLPRVGGASSLVMQSKPTFVPSNPLSGLEAHQLYPDARGQHNETFQAYHPYTFSDGSGARRKLAGFTKRVPQTPTAFPDDIPRSSPTFSIHTLSRTTSSSSMRSTSSCSSDASESEGLITPPLYVIPLISEDHHPYAYVHDPGLHEAKAETHSSSLFAVHDLFLGSRAVENEQCTP
ncbi:uncharacterized protein FIBRA_05263 [Fibroporia radiculosa]|uniref:Homeobox domain-containing protein n=1 Tax=Fibroporia radiculosa TaxID=599839 RepID=J4IAL9_9APHY|nr:uncharacterized protein FIBRA_05263 [Fibroporia radiculosa]CCM03141.1 predicted protein [Fibroporia radiculosa]